MKIENILGRLLEKIAKDQYLSEKTNQDDGENKVEEIETPVNHTLLDHHDTPCFCNYDHYHLHALNLALVCFAVEAVSRRRR